MHKIYEIFEERFIKNDRISRFIQKKEKDISLSKVILSAFFNLLIYLEKNFNDSIVVVLPDEIIVDKIYSLLKEEFSNIKRKISIF